MRIICTDKNYTYEVFTEDCKRLIRAFPFLENGTIGRSVLEKKIPFFRFGKGEKKIILVGAHHGKEWITAMLTMAMLARLCSLYSDRKRYGEQSLTDFYRTRSLYVIPMLNPDGVNLCINGLTDDIPVFLRSRLIGMNGGSRDFVGKWQANIHGVDLNHNYDALFEKGKALAFADGVYGPGAGRYSGDTPESEPESRALADFTRTLLPDLVIAYHSQGEEIFYKFNGYSARGAENLAAQIARKTGYTLIEATGLTDCSGYKDWVIDHFRIPAFTIEVGKGENPLPLTQFDKILEENFSAVISL